MASFFKEIKNKLRDEKEDYGGRYLALILREVINEEPDVASEIWGSKLKNFKTTKEWSFQGRRGPRSADLAATDVASGDALALLEIKYEDHKSEKNTEQLQDYLDYCEKRGLPFVYLTRHLPPDSDLDLVEKKRHCSYSELVQKLEKSKVHGSPVVGMLCDFLREDGFVFQPRIDKDALKLLIAKSALLSDRTKYSDQRITTEVPRTFETILNNVSVIGDLFYAEHGDGTGFFKQRPKLDYRFVPQIDVTKAHRHFTEEEEEVVELDPNWVSSADFWASAVFRFPGTKWAGFDLGFVFSLERGAKENVSSDLYSGFYLSKHEDILPAYAEYKLGDSQDQTYRRMLKLARKTLGNGLETYGDSLDQQQRSTMVKLLKRLKGK